MSESKIELMPTSILAKKRLSFFDRYLSLWVALCIIVGVAIGKTAPELVQPLSRLQVSHVNLPVAVLIWLMIYPMMLRIDFASIREVGRRPTGVLLTVFVNWFVKPFSMAFLGWLFFKHVFAGIIDPSLADQYLAGAILLAAAPCTGMVFVWSYLTDGDPAYTLVQVALNDLIMLVAFAPVVIFLLGVTSITVPYGPLLASVLIYVVVPLAAGIVSRIALLRTRGEAWFEGVFLARLKPVAIGALLATLVMIFAFQGEIIVSTWAHIGSIAIPMDMKKNGVNRSWIGRNSVFMWTTRGSRLNTNPANSAPMAKDRPSVAATEAMTMPIPTTTRMASGGPALRISRVTRRSTNMAKPRHPAPNTTVFTMKAHPISNMAAMIGCKPAVSSTGTTAIRSAMRKMAETSSNSATSRRSAPLTLFNAPASSQTAADTATVVAVSAMAMNRLGTWGSPSP